MSDTAANVSIRERLWRVPENFVAFIYAAAVAVVIHQAHDGKLFDYFVLTFMLFGGIFFLAQDWLNRFAGVHQIRLGEIRPLSFVAVFYAKVILDVAVAVCLCLTILDVVQVMTRGPEDFLHASKMGSSFYCKLAIFGLVSGFWNIVVISVVVGAIPALTVWNIRAFLLKGHIGDEILDLFPKWRDKLKAMEGWIETYRQDIEKSGQKLTNESTPVKHFWRGLKSMMTYLRKRFISGPIRLAPLTLTCWLGLHLLLLNLVLGSMILLSASRLHGQPLNSVLPASWEVSRAVFISLLVLVVYVVLFCRVAYFASANKRPLVEFIGYWMFWVFLAAFYASLSVRELAWALVAQQIVANVFIFGFLTVPADSSAIGAPLNASPATGGK